jgi:hypothetical protein
VTSASPSKPPIPSPTPNLTHFHSATVLEPDGTAEHFEIRNPRPNRRQRWSYSPEPLQLKKALSQRERSLVLSKNGILIRPVITSQDGIYRLRGHHDNSTKRCPYHPRGRLDYERYPAQLSGFLPLPAICGFPHVRPQTRDLQRHYGNSQAYQEWMSHKD